MSHPEFFSGIACPCCLFFKRESRGRQPFGGVCPQGTKPSFTSHTPPLAACERRKKVLGAQPPSPQSRGGCPLHPRRGAFQAPRKFDTVGKVVRPQFGEPGQRNERYAFCWSASLPKKHRDE